MSGKNNHTLPAARRFASAGLLLVLVILLLVLPMKVCNSMGDSKSDDASMTEKLLDAYMSALCDYNLSGVNKCCMARLDPYDDCEEAVKACGVLAGHIRWECENISIDGNSAIAQVNLTLPADFARICELALDDVMKTVDSGSDGDPAGLLTSAIRKRAGKAETTRLSAEIAMTKVNNKWYIVKSLSLNRVLSDIRTPVAYVYAVIGE